MFYVSNKQKVKVSLLKDSKACSTGARFKLFYHVVDREGNGVGLVLKEKLMNVVEVKRVSDRGMCLKAEVEGLMLNVVVLLHRLVDLDEVMENILREERVVIAADLTGHVSEGNTGDEDG